MEQANSNYEPWSFLRKLFFRFTFIFFVLFIFFTPNGFYPYIQDAYQIYIQPFYKFIPWVGKHVLKLPYEITSFPNGSGDTTYDYLVLLLNVLLSFLGCIIWTLIDKKRFSYNTLNYWLTVGVRYYVGFTMLNYGLIKVFGIQFSFPNPYTLLEPYGASSPMRLAWTFFGYSTAYNYFVGFAEIMSGALLLFRRTNRAGILLTVVVSANIMAVNYCFDVCVKLLSTVLLLMSLFLLTQHRKHFAAFFAFNKHAEPGSMLIPKFRKKGLNTSLVVLKYAAITFMLYKTFSDFIRDGNEYGPNAAKPPLYGIYDVQTFVKNNDTVAPLTTDTVRWRKLIVFNRTRSAISLMNDSIKSYVFKPDTTTKKIEVYYAKDTVNKSNLSYAFIGKDNLLLRGKWFNDSVTITLKRYDLNNFLLVNRGFNLISEVPFNK